MGFFALEQADLIERGAHPLAAFAVIETADLQRQQHVVEHAAVEQQLVVLEDDAEVAAQIGNAPPLSAPTFWLLTSTLPELGRSIAAMSLSSVLLPAPECPVRNTISPSAISNETFFSAS